MSQEIQNEQKKRLALEDLLEKIINQQKSEPGSQIEKKKSLLDSSSMFWLLLVGCIVGGGTSFLLKPLFSQ